MKHIATIFLICFMQLSAGIGVGYSGVGALPVELISFSARRTSEGIELRWETATEVNNFGFDVERSRPNPLNGDVIWEKITFIQGNGNSNSPKSYSFLDKKPVTEKVKYRLKQIDNTGTFKYSPVIEIGTGINKYDLSQNYPNPFKSSTTISYSLADNSQVKIEIYDILGKAVSTLVEGVQDAGSYSINFSKGKLSSGVYIYKIKAGNFVAIKKMIVLE